MKAIIMGTSACAVDTVRSHTVHVDPDELIHLWLTPWKGFGPMNGEEIDVGGVSPLETVQGEVPGFECGTGN